jgi:NitT/TauT family transport system substrate-binding protein
MDPASMGPALIAGRVDAAPFAAWHETRLQMQARDQGKKLKRLDFADYGLDAYSLTMFARSDALQNNADAIKRFIRASHRAIRYTWQGGNVDEAAAAVVKANPVAEFTAVRGAAETGGRLANDADISSGKFAVGQMDPERVSRIRDLYVKFLSLKRSPAIEELFTNDFLPEKK